MTPTQDAPCLPGAGSDDDGHPDGAPSSLPRHPTGECPHLHPPKNSVTPSPAHLLMHYLPLLAKYEQYKIFHLKLFISETGKNETPLPASEVAVLKDLGTTPLWFLLLLFPPFLAHFGVAGFSWWHTWVCILPLLMQRVPPSSPASQCSVDILQ